jgi:hypothetical protein
LHCCIGWPNRRSFTTIHRADFEIKKLNINGESTVETGVNMPHTIISCTQQLLINRRDVESTIGANVGDTKNKFGNRRLLFRYSRKFWE